jgi:hypothetical protein
MRASRSNDPPRLCPQESERAWRPEIQNCAPLRRAERCYTVKRYAVQNTLTRTNTKRLGTRAALDCFVEGARVVEQSSAKHCQIAT